MSRGDIRPFCNVKRIKVKPKVILASGLLCRAAQHTRIILQTFPIESSIPQCAFWHGRSPGSNFIDQELFLFSLDRVKQNCVSKADIENLPRMIRTPLLQTTKVSDEKFALLARKTTRRTKDLSIA